MLPDIDQQDWDAYQQQQLQQQLQQKIDGFGLDQMLGDRSATVGAVATPPPPTPPSIEQSLANIGGWAAPPPTLPPEPTPPPETAPSGPSPEQPEAAAPAPPEPSPAPPAPTPPQPGGGGLSSSWLADVFGNGLNAVQQAGGDVDAFAQSFGSSINQAGQGMHDVVGNALTAAQGSGADLDQFASSFQLPTPPSPAGTSAPVSGVPDWLGQLISRNAPGELANDPDFIRTVAAGAKAESGWNINAVQQGGGGRGLFQFDLGGMGAGIPEAQLLGSEGAEMQASRIIPLYAKAYQSAPQGLTGAEKASWVAAQAERPAGFTDPASAARRNYASAFNELSAGPGLTPQDLLARTGGWAQQAAAQPASQVSQFGQPQLSNDEAYAACGPAAAVRFAQMYGRNPTLREATDLAATVGWTSAGGMAGLGSEKALMDKLGVATRAVGPDVNAMAREAQTGNPVTISTPGHYFFADGYDPQSGAFHVGQSGLDLRGGSEWMTADQMQQRMGRIQGALFADNPQVPATSTADRGVAQGFGDFFSNVGATFHDAFQPATPTESILPDSTSTTTSTSPPAIVEDQTPAERLKSAFGDFIDSVGQNAMPQSQRDVLGQAGENFDQAPVLGGVKQAVGGALGNLGEQEQSRVGQVLENLTPQGVISAELNPGVAGSQLAMQLAPNLGEAATAGLERAGVPGHEDFGFEVGPLQVGPREVAGQIANLLIPMGGEEQGARLAREAAGELAGRGLGALDVLSPPEVAYAATRKPSTTGNAVRDATIKMFRDQDTQPSLPDRVAEGVANAIGLGGRTGTLDTAAADKWAQINQMSGRAREALGSAFTPEMDAESLLATYAGRGARAKLLVDDEITPALRGVREVLGQKEGDEYLNEFRKYQRDLEVANLYGGAREASGGVKTAADAQAALDSLEQEVGPKGWAALQQGDKMLNDATTRLLQARVDAGMIDPDLAQRLMTEQPHYNPTVLMKYLDEEAGGVSGGGNRLVTTDNLLRRLAGEGSEDATEQPLRSLVRHFMQSDVLNNRNGVASAILDAAMNDPTLVDAAGAPLVKRINPMQLVTGPEVAGPGGAPMSQLLGAPSNIATVLRRMSGDVPGRVSKYENGKRVYYDVSQVPGLESLMKNLEGTDPGALGKVLQALNAPLRWGATAASPSFLATNAIRDFITTFVREGGTTAKNIPRGMLSAARQDDLWRQYIQAGGGMESLYQRSPQDIDKLIADTGGLVLHDQSDLARLAMDALKLKFITRAGEVIEQGPHLAAFEQHLLAGESPAEAATSGRRATVDFQRSGDILQQLNMASLFLNARSQGLLNIGRSLRDDPIARLRLGGLAAAVAANNERNQQDPAFYDIPEYERRQNAIIMLPGSEKNANGIGYKTINRLSIPLGELSAFTDPVNWISSHADPDQSHWDPRSPQDVGLGALSTISPISGDSPSSVAGSFFPAPLRTPSELAANRRFYTGLPIVPQAYQDLPPSAQANDRTSLLARRLGEAYGVSPMQIDFLINENLGTLGRYGLGVTDAAMGKEGTSLPGAIIGGLTSGVVRNYGGQMAADKYDRLDQLMGEFQEPVVAKTVRQLPEYNDPNTTDDRKLSMMRTAQLHLRDTLRDQVGIPNSAADTGLPQKYPGVTDAQEEAHIDRAVARWNAYKADPTHAPPPTNEEVQLASLYGGIVSPVYRVSEQIQQQQNRAIDKLIEDHLAAAQGR